MLLGQNNKIGRHFLKLKPKPKFHEVRSFEALCPEPALPTDFWFCEVVNLFVAYAN